MKVTKLILGVSRERGVEKGYFVGGKLDSLQFTAFIRQLESNGDNVVAVFLTMRLTINLGSLA